MKAGDVIKLFSARGDSYEVGTVVELLEESVKYKKHDVGGHFITLKSRCALLYCEGCGCDPCDCHWGMAVPYERRGHVTIHTVSQVYHALCVPHRERRTP